MYEILPWVGVGILLFLCLPILLTQKLILEVSTWVLRLALIGLLSAGVYLAFRPGELPAGQRGRGDACEQRAGVGGVVGSVTFLTENGADPGHTDRRLHGPAG